jgi:hypothetical protein
MIFDREVKIGHASKKEKQNLSVDISLSILNKIGKNNLAKIKPGISDEVDLVGVSSSGNDIVLIETKNDLTSADKIYYAPIQLLHYIKKWKQVLNSESRTAIIQNINNLIEVKQSLGLISRQAPKLTDSKTLGIKTVLAVEKTNWSDEVSSRLKYVLKVINEETEGLMKNFEIWEYPRGLWPRKFEII